MNPCKYGDRMTHDHDRPAFKPAAPAASTSHPLPFDPSELAQGVRVTQADFARMAGVSRQTVSQWVKLGKIRSVYPDGRLDPARAAREVIKNTEPGKLRARLFKVAAEDAAALRTRAMDLQHQLDEALAYIAAIPAALREAGLTEAQIEYVEWCAGEGRNAPDDPDPDGIEDLEGLPLFDDEGQTTQTPLEQLEHLEQTPESRAGPGSEAGQVVPGY